jgi:hypothetical protein
VDPVRTSCRLHLEYRARAQNLDDPASGRDAGQERSFHIPEEPRAGLLTGEEQAVAEGIGQRPPDRRHLAGCGDRVSGQLASDRRWDEAVKPLELRVGYEREEARRLHADQGVGCAAKNSG